MKMFIGNHKNCLDPKGTYHNLVWTDLDPQYLASNEYIQNRLTTQ